jgi:hypothetical protein
MADAKVITFGAICRNGHEAVFTYAAPELRQLLQTRSLQFYCDRCIAIRPPSSAETHTLIQRVLQSELESP